MSLTGKKVKTMLCSSTSSAKVSLYRWLNQLEFQNVPRTVIQIFQQVSMSLDVLPKCISEPEKQFVTKTVVWNTLMSR